MKRSLPRPTYANVVATLALFIALGGAAYAATALPKNSVGTKQIKNGAVTGAKIRNKAVTGADVRAGTLGGAQINEAKLGTVPHAAQADNAQKVGGMNQQQLAEAAKLHCPSGTILAAGVCFGSETRPAAVLGTAQRDCAGADGRLPTVGEVITFATRNLPTALGFEWAEPVYLEGPELKGMLVDAAENFVKYASAGDLTSHPYRCVVLPSN